MNHSSAMENINRRTMRESAAFYASSSRLNAPERRVVSEIADTVRHKRILDLGVGGGRTTQALLQISTNYIGIDYVPEMVAACRARFPGVKFEHADARAMPQFQDKSFDVVFFASNGLCMVDHAGRIAILKEVRRVLADGGIFIFSAYNQNSAEFERWFEFPAFDRYTKNPVKLATRMAKFAAHTVYSFANRLRFRKHETRTSEYSIINDRCHHYRTMLYYISMENQLRQLQTVGFAATPTIYDTSGELASPTSRSDSLTYVLRI
jgi:SAM-dependent methyltransferase